MDPGGMFPMLVRYLPAIFLGVTGMLVGVLFSAPMVDHVLPRIYGRKLSSRQSVTVRWICSLGMAAICFLMAGQFGLGGGTAGGLPGEGEMVNSTPTSKTDPVKVVEKRGGEIKNSKSPGLVMRILGPDLAKEYSGATFSPNNLFWFAEIHEAVGAPAGGGVERRELLDWTSAQKKILEWKGNQVPGKIRPIRFLYTTRDPDDSSPLVVEVTRWCRENGVSLERQTTAEGLP